MAKETVIIADETKIVQKLGVSFPVPVRQLSAITQLLRDRDQGLVDGSTIMVLILSFILCQVEVLPQAVAPVLRSLASLGGGMHPEHGQK